ncbi:MAG: hypothetical protein ORO03_06755 [Alphaproteobacteria bacterium]|nr:hypothetical protein [Alphaproteobacteria bacterium]
MKHQNNGSWSSSGDGRKVSVTLATLVRSTYTQCLMRIHESMGGKTESRAIARQMTADLVHRNARVLLSDQEIRDMVDSSGSDRPVAAGSKLRNGK